MIINVSPSQSNLVWTPPKWTLQVVRTTANGRVAREPTSIEGASENFTPVSLSIAEGPGGSTLRVRVEKDYYMARVHSAPADYINDVFYLVRKVDDITRNDAVALRSTYYVDFVGTVVGIDYSHANDTDQIELVLNNWNLLAKKPVTIGVQPEWTIGQYVKALSLGTWTEIRLVGGVKTEETETFIAGTPLNDANAFVDHDLLEIDQAAENVSFVGQSWSAAICSMIKKAGLIPDIEYVPTGDFVKSGKIDPDNPPRLKIVGREKLGKKRRITVRRINDPNVTGAGSQEITAESISGNETHDLFNTVYAVGQPVRTIDVITLNKGWSASEESDVLADKTLLTTDKRYAHVGRVYYAPNPLKPFAPSKAGSEPTYLQGDSIRVAVRRDSSDSWHAYDGTFKIRPNLLESEARNTVDHSTSLLVLDKGNNVVLEFDAPLLWGPYYSSSDNTTRQGGTVVSGSYGFYEVKIEAVILGDELVVTKHATTDYAREAVKEIRNDKAVKEVFSKRFDVYTADSVTETTTPDRDLRDDTETLEKQAQSLLDDVSRPERSLQVILAKTDPTWVLGDRIDTIQNEDGELLYEGIDMRVSGADHDLQAPYTTRLTLSQFLAESSSTGGGVTILRSGGGVTVGAV